MKTKKAETFAPTLCLHHKDSQISKQQSAETRIFFEYLQNHIATCSMVCDSTGIKQKSATRYKRDLEKSNRLWEVDHRRCDITGFKAAWLTTDPRQIPLVDNVQLSLFEGGEP